MESVKEKNQNTKCLFRPFVLGFAVVIFPSVIAMINGVMSPTVTGTAAMVKDSNKAIAVLLQKKEAIKKTDVWKMYVSETGSGDRDKWYKYTHPDSDLVGSIFGAKIAPILSMCRSYRN